MQKPPISQIGRISRALGKPPGWGLMLFVSLCSPLAFAQAPALTGSTEISSDSQTIEFFEVRGVSAVPASEIRAVTEPFLGQKKTPENVRKALTAIEQSYRTRGNIEARVKTGDHPTRGAILIEVTESPRGITPTPPESTVATSRESDRFNIEQFVITGAELLPPEEVRNATAPFTGRNKTFGDIQKTLETIEGLYRKRGLSAVQVLLPEQDITQGRVLLRVIETPIGKVVIQGNNQYSVDNIRRSLPALQEKQSPNSRALSQNIQLANENQGKQIDLVLAVGSSENTVDARIEVKEDQAYRFFVTADNSGTPSTGDYRLGLGFLHNNILDLDHSASIAYTKALNAPDAVDIKVASLSYRIPFYELGDSLTLLYGYSDVSTPSSQSTGFALNGKGNLGSARWNFYLPRRGEFSSQVQAGIDWKEIKSTCLDTQNAPVTGTAGCIDYTITPISLAYSHRKDSVGHQFEYSFGFSQNIPSGKTYDFVQGNAIGRDRYSLASGNREVNDHFSLLRLSGSYSTTVGKWLTRFALNGQYTPGGAMVSSEQLGLTGALAVRGFLERIVASDSGAVVNLETYSPDIAAELGLPGHTMRALAFIDAGYGHDNNATAIASKKLASWGLGLRYQYRKDISVKLDAASILVAEPEDAHRGSNPSGGVLDDNNKNDWRIHGAVMLSF